MTGKEIFEEVGKRHGKPIEFEKQKLTLTDDKGTEQVRDVKRYARTVGPGEQRFLMVFHSPPAIRGTATITWKRRFKDDGQWIYLPATGGKPVRIVSGGKRNYVMGTDFAAEDLASEPVSKLAFERLDDEEVDGKDHFVIEVTPKDADLKAETGYKRRRLWIDQENFFVMRTDYYDWRDTLVKRQTASDVKNVEDDVWRADSQTMENFKDGHKPGSTSSSAVSTRTRCRWNCFFNVPCCPATTSDDGSIRGSATRDWEDRRGSHIADVWRNLQTCCARDTDWTDGPFRPGRGQAHDRHKPARPDQRRRSRLAGLP